MDLNRFSRLVERPLRSNLAILAVNAALILVSGTIFGVLGIVSARWEVTPPLAFPLFLLFVVGSILLWHLFGRLLRGRFTAQQRLAAAAVGVLPILAAAGVLEASAEGAMCGILGAYVTGAGAGLTAFLTVMIASGIDPRFDLESGRGRSPT